MKSVIFEVGRNFEINPLTGLNLEYKTADVEVLVFGDLMGLIYDGRVYNSKEAFALLIEKSDSSDDICKLMRYLVGACFVLIKTTGNFRVYCSPSSPGVFFGAYNGKILVSNDEAFVFGELARKEQIDEDQLFNFVISNALAIRTPFHTIFRNILRCPCGSFVSFDKELSTKVDTYNIKNLAELKDSSMQSSFKKDLVTFSFLLENTLKLICDYCKDKKLLLSKSGGIDSTILLVALKKIQADFCTYHVPYNGSEDLTVTLARSITDFFNVDMKIRDYEEPVVASLRDRARSGLGVIHGPLFFQFNHYTFRKDGSENVVDIIGQNADSLYAIDTFAPCSIFSGPSRWIPIWKSIKKRIYYTDRFLDPRKHRFWMKFWPFKVGKGKLDRSYKDYLTTTITPAGEHVVPLSEVENNEMSDKNREIKMRYLYEPVMERALQKYSDDMSEIEKDPLSKNHIIRTLRWYRTIQNAPVNYHNVGRFEEVDKIIPYSEGPISDFFLNYVLKLKDAFYIKRLSYAYFKKNTGKNYKGFVRRLYPNFIVRVLRLPFLIIGRMFKKELNYTRDQFLVGVNVLNKMINSDEKYLSNFFEDSALRNYVSKSYDKFKTEDPRKLSGGDLSELCRLANVEILLKEVLGEKNI